MAIALIQYGALRVDVKYLQNRRGLWYFRRRIPADVRPKYPLEKGSSSSGL
ncbi:DUF6538 domain-containing protein [Pseudooceanicola sp.]|uniref:DUF6538 domain-containing protein n=1 Tax=Pseudooceanicola sp. TaxID=1914328 RepID=UPI003513086A